MKERDVYLSGDHVKQVMKNAGFIDIDDSVRYFNNGPWSRGTFLLVFANLPPKLHHARRAPTHFGFVQ